MDISQLPNFQIATLALWKIGGATSPQYPEDVAVKCFELAPVRFGWRRYPEYPNLETAAVALRDAKKSKNGALVSGNNRIGWLIAAEGMEWIQQSRLTLTSVDTMGSTPALRREDLAELNALRSHKAFTLWQDQIGHIHTYQVADAVRLTAEAPDEIIRHRVDELYNKARLAGVSELQEYVKWLRANVAKEP